MKMFDRVHSVFYDKATVRIKTVTWPETGGSQDFIVIETQLDVEEANKLLRKLENTWGLKVMPEDGSLALELRFV